MAGRWERVEGTRLREERGQGERREERQEREVERGG